MKNEILKAIGNVEASAEVDGVLYTLASDSVVRVNDADTGEIVHRIKYPTHERAAKAYRKAVADAKASARAFVRAMMADFDGEQF